MSDFPQDTEPAGDAVDAILLHELSDRMPTVDGDAGSPAARFAVVDDSTGALALGLARSVPGAEVRVHCDSLADETRVRAAAAAAGVPLVFSDEVGPELLAGVTAVVLRLPKSLAALDETAEAVAKHADAGVQVLAGGRVKHMSHGMNKVLAGHFEDVAASLGRQKSRVLVASGVRTPAGPGYPRCEPLDDLGLTVCAHGGAFAGTSLDLGTRFLASFVAGLEIDARSAVDLGCGTGVLATLLARRLPDARVLATDESRAACRSAAATAERNQVAGQVDVTCADLLSGVPDGGVDLVLCNPPFHRGTARDSDVAFAMFADARRALRPGGELWVVYNSHLPYLPALRRVVGQTTVVGQNDSYFVTRSRTPAG